MERMLSVRVKKLRNYFYADVIVRDEGGKRIVRGKAFTTKDEAICDSLKLARAESVISQSEREAFLIHGRFPS